MGSNNVGISLFGVNIKLNFFFFILFYG